VFTGSFWTDAIERAAKTVAQALIAVVAATNFDWISADWAQIASIAATAGVLSLLTSVASDRIGAKGTPSILPAPEAPDLRNVA
jgi:hypothetical protein